MSLKLINNLKFAEKINGNEALTEAGKDFLKGYRSYCYNNPVNCTVVNSFLNEAKNFGFDTGVMALYESISSYIKENNISWKFSSACESIQNNPSSYAYIAKTAVGKVQQLLEMNEPEVIAYVKAGALKDVQYVTEFRNICKEVYANSNQISESRTSTFEATIPCSYVFVNENKESFFMVNGKTFKSDNNTVCESVCNDPMFNRINSILATMGRKDDALVYEMNNGFGKSIAFAITENNITMQKNDKVETFETADKFLEHVNTITLTMGRADKMNMLNVACAIKDVFEAMDSICELDQVKNIRTSANEVFSIIESTNNVIVNEFRMNGQAGQQTESFDYITEALKFVQKTNKVNLMGIYEKRIEEDAKKENPDEVKEITEAVKAAKCEKIALTKQRIAMLAEQYKNDPVKISLLNTAAKKLAIFESK